jgi:hypothetical protein
VRAAAAAAQSCRAPAAAVSIGSRLRGLWLPSRETCACVRSRARSLPLPPPLPLPAASAARARSLARRRGYHEKLKLEPAGAQLRACAHLYCHLLGLKSESGFGPVELVVTMPLPGARCDCARTVGSGSE